MNKTAAISLICILTVCRFFLTACAEVAQPEWWKQAAAPYKGSTIRGISENSTASKIIAKIAAKEFEELTGITVEFEPTMLDDMYNKALNDIQAGRGIYDFVYLEQDIVNMYLAQGWLVNLSQLMNFNRELVYEAFGLEDFTNFIDHFKDEKGDIYGIPFEAFLKIYVYRKDLFEDAAVQKAFQAQYGQSLHPPATWDEYERIAEFFTRWGREHGIELYGHTAQAKNYTSLACEMEESIWPSWGIWNWGLNLENWRASSVHGGTLDTKRAIQALKWYVNMLRYAPPDVRTYTWDEAAESVASGQVAQGLLYGENVIWIATDASLSQVTGKIGVSLPPALPEVMHEAKTGKEYIGYYDGAAFGIPVSSRNKEAALLFLQFVTRKEWGPEFAAKAGRVVRQSTFDSPLIQELDQKIDGYYTLLQEAEQLFAGAPEFPMHLLLRKIQLKWIAKAVAGEMTAEEACNTMAEDIDDTLEALGYSRP